MEISSIVSNKIESWYFNCEQGNRFSFASLGKSLFAYYILKYIDIDLD